MNPSEFLALLHARHCQRSFLDKPVERQIIESVLLAAGRAPSGKNSQPWKVTVAAGGRRDALSNALCSAFDAGEKAKADYEYSLFPPPEEWVDRARACGYALFDLKGIERGDHEARRAHGRENFTFFGAPMVIIFHLPRGAERGNFLDVGIFMQNVMLGLTVHGLGSCPQFSVAEYANIVRQSVGLAEDRCIVAGMSVGWPDVDAKVNTFAPERLPLDDYVNWLES